jgi:uncharacterized protein
MRDSSEIRNSFGERLDATFTPAARDGVASGLPVVVIGHGVTSHKERPWLVRLAEACAAAGFDALRFTFAGNHGSEGSFGAATIDKEVDDLGAVIEHLEGRPVVYAGHSMGAAVGVLRAVRDPRIVGLVSLAGMVETRAFADRVFADLEPGEPMLGKPECPFHPELTASMRRIGSLASHAERIAVPWLFVHGSRDELVPLAESEQAASAAGALARLVVLEGADHRFTGHEEAMAKAVVAWLVGGLAPVESRPHETA